MSLGDELRSITPEEIFKGLDAFISKAGPNIVDGSNLPIRYGMLLGISREAVHMMREDMHIEGHGYRAAAMAATLVAGALIEIAEARDLQQQFPDMPEEQPDDNI